MNKFISTLLIVLNSVLFMPQIKAQDASNSQDVAGRKQGHWIKFNENQKKIYDGNFVDDLPEGKFTYFYESGTPWSITIFSKKGTIGYSKLFNTEGKITGEGKYVNQKKDSLWKFYDVDGKVISNEMYLNGEKNGSAKVFYPNSQLAEEKLWLNGKIDGASVKYFDDGTLKFKCNYVKDKIDGKAVYYYPTGKVSVEGNYKNDFKNGSWKYYNQDGTVKKTVEFINSKPQGKDQDLISKEEEEKAKKYYEEKGVQDKFSGEGEPK